MSSRNTYHPFWVSLTLDVGYLFTCSSKAQPLLLSLDEGYLLTAPPPDLEHGVAPLSPLAPVQSPLLGHGVAPLAPAPDLGSGILLKPGLDESQARIKSAWKNINHLIYANNNILMTKSEVELNSLLM